MRLNGWGCVGVTPMILGVDYETRRLPILNDFVLADVRNDLTSFATFSPSCGTKFVTATGTSLTMVRTLVGPGRLAGRLGIVAGEVCAGRAGLHDGVSFLRKCVGHTDNLALSGGSFNVDRIEAGGGGNSVRKLVNTLGFLVAGIGVPTGLATLATGNFAPTRGATLAALGSTFGGSGISRGAGVGSHGGGIVTGCNGLGTF